MGPDLLTQLLNGDIDVEEARLRSDSEPLSVARRRRLDELLALHDQLSDAPGSEREDEWPPERTSAFLSRAEAALGRPISSTPPAKVLSMSREAAAALSRIRAFAADDGCDRMRELLADAFGCGLTTVNDGLQVARRWSEREGGRGGVDLLLRSPNAVRKVQIAGRTTEFDGSVYRLDVDPGRENMADLICAMHEVQFSDESIVRFQITASPSDHQR